MNKKIVIGNWKMHLTVPEGTVLIEKLKNELTKISKTEVVVVPGFLNIYPASIELKDSKIKLGAQNLFYEGVGEYTGEVSPSQLAHFVEYVIVGHSERRRHFGETDKVIARKVEAAISHGIIPVICVGETLHEYEDGMSKTVVMNQLEAAISHLTDEEIAGSVIAYEPVWAIGTGRVCSHLDAEKMTESIRNLIKALYGENASERVRIVYGGSIDSECVKEFAESKNIDGVLVGGDSLNSTDFAKVVEMFEDSLLKGAKR